MKPKIFLVFFSVVFASSYSHSQGAPTEEERELLLDAILWKESNGDPNAVGDEKNGVYRAKGAYQIWKSYWKDANVPWEYKKDAWDAEKSREVCRRYMKRYAKDGSLEKWARIHNGGPKGMKKEDTLKYWKDIQIKMKKLVEDSEFREKMRDKSHTNPLYKKIVSDNLAKPGGVTLSMAVAENLILPIDIRAASYDKTNNALILVGPESEYAFDAGLLLTALRIGSDQEVNQIDSVQFSLDTVDEAAFENMLALMALIKLDPLPEMQKNEWSGISINEYNADIIHRHFLWPQSELRFYPEWLKNTRYGEILYKADLILKELAGVLQPDSDLEIEYNRIPWDVYVPPIKLDLFCKEGIGSYGMRLWFDYTTTIREALGTEELSSVFDRKTFHTTTRKTSFHTTTKVSLAFCPAHNSIKSGESGTFRSASYHHNDSFDLERVHPYMSVRNHEGGQDLPGVSPHYEYASLQVGNYINTIAKQFPEIQQLVNLFRVSLIAWKLQKSYPKLLDSFQYKESVEEFEELSEPLPKKRNALVGVYRRGTKNNPTVYTVNGGVGMSFRDVEFSEVNENHILLEHIQNALKARKSPDSFCWTFNYGVDTWYAYSIILKEKTAWEKWMPFIQFALIVLGIVIFLWVIWPPLQRRFARWAGV